MRMAACIRIAVLSAFALTRLASADDVLHLGTATLDRPTLVTLGVQLLVTGDDDRDAQVAVRYRPVGNPTWRDAMPLFRVHPEDVVGRVVPEQFAGSIFNLAPGTDYEIELHATDADGPVDQTLTLTGTTRSVPVDPTTPNARSVSDAAGLQAALDTAQPGDVITLAEGIYQGSFEMSASGTAANPIVIRGASEDGAVLDGHGCSTCNLLEVDGSFVHVERLTLQNAVRGLRFKTAGTEGNVARRLHLRDVANGIVGDPDQRDFYLCDNVLEGRLTWPLVYEDDGGRHSGSDDGINVAGFGHAVCHNQLVGFADAMKVEQDGSRADDFYGNEVLSAYDNAVELDTSEGNTRAFRNRFTNTFVPLSFQPTFGGPVYALRNVVVNVAEDQLKFYARGPGEVPNGVLVLHNTFVSPEPALLMGSTATSHHFVIQDNLFDGVAGTKVVDWIGGIDDGAFDWNGWFPDGTFDFHAAGSWPSFAAMQAAGLFETNGTLLAAPIFASGLAPPSTFRVTMAAEDATLDAASNAVDAATSLANVDDGFTGAAPDLGALERGCPEPLFGVRPDGIDETNEPYGCGGPTVTTTTLPYVTVQTASMSLRGGSGRIAFKSDTKREPAAHRVVAPAPGGAGDPRIGGATLTAYNATGNGDLVTVPLPAAGWSAVGSSYRYRGVHGSAIASVRVQADRLQVKGGGPAWTYTLDEPAQRRVALQLVLGGDLPWCAAALAKVRGNPPSSASSDKPGVFVAQPKTAAPLVCPPTP
jgi:hypothetical protein